MLTENRFTAMAKAFYLACINTPRHPVAAKVGDAISRNAGLLKVRGWNANLSFKTAFKLKQAGVIPA